jgi:hypothetical protein
LALSRTCGYASSWNREDQTAKPLHPCRSAVFFSAAGRPILPFSFRLGIDHGHAPDEVKALIVAVTLKPGTMGNAV